MISGFKICPSMCVYAWESIGYNMYALKQWINFSYF